MAASQVRAFYSGKNFFITGGTGFLGMCLIERILRSLPDAGTIYLLMRPKRGRGVEERMEEIKKNPIFETLLRTDTAIFKKVVPVAGDIGESNLGLSPEDRKLIDGVDIIVHSAAGLDFDLSLKEAMEINVFGTRRVLDLACQLKELKCIIHVSSASVNTFIEGAKEILYDVPENVNHIIKLLETLNQDELSRIEPTLLKNHRLPYTFTKHLAEHEVAKCADKFPCVIVRPSAILTIWKKPVAGWTNSKAGPIAFIMGASMGVVRRAPALSGDILDIIPVDVVVNHLLAAGYQASKAGGLSIYHCTSSTQKPYHWKILIDVMKEMMHQYPLKSAIWYPYIKTVKPFWLFKISVIIMQFIPAVFLDLLLHVTGRCSIFSIMKKLWNILRSIELIYDYEWRLCNANTIELARQMNETDKRLFYIDISEIDWKEYTTVMFLGIRKYMHREDESTIEEAKFKDTVLFLAYIIWHVTLFSILWSLFASLMGLTMTQSVWCVPVLYIMYSFL